MEAMRVVPRRLESTQGKMQFCIGRMVTRCGVLTVGAARGLQAARARIKELSESWPGDYVVFVRNSGRVVAKASNAVQG
jgi:hypothetical protein